MKLQPYEDIGYRRYKVLEHAFGKPERWWEVDGGLQRWLLTCPRPVASWAPARQAAQRHQAARNHHDGGDHG